MRTPHRGSRIVARWGRLSPSRLGPALTVTPTIATGTLHRLPEAVADLRRRAADASDGGHPSPSPARHTAGARRRAHPAPAPPARTRRCPHPNRHAEPRYGRTRAHRDSRRQPPATPPTPRPSLAADGARRDLSDPGNLLAACNIFGRRWFATASAASARWITPPI